jgi:CBS domain-containing protein
MVLGLLPLTEAEQADSQRAVEDLMSPGPTTTRADEPLEELLERMENAGVDRILITDPEGRLLGEVDAHEARTRLKESGTRDS